MIVYPNQSKSIFIDFYKAKASTAHPEYFADTLGAITSSTLTELYTEFRFKLVSHS
jgi:hypothetical protein